MGHAAKGNDMIICHERQLIFIKTRKVGGTSFEIALSKYCGPDCVITPISPEDEMTRSRLGFRGPQNFEEPLPGAVGTGAPRKPGVPTFYHHVVAAHVRANVPEDVWNSYKKVSIVRNPYDVLISRYFYQLKVKNYTQQQIPFGTFAVIAEKTLQENEATAPFSGPDKMDVFLRYEHLAKDIETLGIDGLGETFASLKAKGGMRPNRGASMAEMYARFPFVAEYIEKYCQETLSRFGYQSPLKNAA